MMIGGPREVFEHCRPLFAAFGVEGGWDLVSEESGAGHYVKMAHNAIEYGMMQAIAEGFDLMSNGHFEALDLHRIAALWNHGTVVSSFLMEMVERALGRGDLATLAPRGGQRRGQVGGAGGAAPRCAVRRQRLRAQRAVHLARRGLASLPASRGDAARVRRPRRREGRWKVTG
jgi:6-phosphogluconate dehydrogenase